MKTRKRVISVFTTIAMLMSVITFMPLTAAASIPAELIPAELTAHEFVAKMKTGWNLGNTFDAVGGGQTSGADANANADRIAQLETMWLGGSSSLTTQSLIRELKRQGFDTIRIPVTWHKAADPNNNWQINALWMARVKQVVDWAIAEDMFVILNTHHENRVLNLAGGNASQSTHAGNLFVTNIWRQIAEAFKDYDERLIFASLNEPREERGENEWNGGTATVQANVNHLNQAFVDVVRASGGNNENRFLIVPPVAAGSNSNSLNSFRVPLDLPQHRITVGTGTNVGYGNTNISSSKIIWAVHTYSPFDWAHDGNGSYGGMSTITGDLDRVKARADALGLPVILSEWGSVSASEPASARAQHAADYIFAARERGMVAVWWDNGQGSASSHGFGIISRRHQNGTHEIYHPHIIKGIMDGLAGNIIIPRCGGKDVIQPLGAPTMDTGNAQQRGWNLNAAHFAAATHLSISWTGNHSGGIVVILNGGGNDPGWQMTHNVLQGQTPLSSLAGYSTLTSTPQLFIADWDNGLGVFGTITLSFVVPACGKCSDCPSPAIKTENIADFNVHAIQLTVPAGRTGRTEIEVGREYAGQNAVLVKYNAAIGELEFVTAATIASNGSANLGIDHAGDYLLKVFKTGDVTGTGEVETADALAVLLHIAGISKLNSVQLFVANGKEGEINTSDALSILKIVAGL
jgi:endoglucanase